MVTFLLALALAPWTQPLSFHPLVGWQSGTSGNTHSVYDGHGTHVATPLESTAWFAKGVRYRDAPTADPPNKTLQHLPRQAVIVWAVIYNPADVGQQPIRLALSAAKRFACCEAVGLVGGEYELTGAGPSRAYSVIVRIYFGERPTSVMRAQAQRALNQLRLPRAR